VDVTEELAGLVDQAVDIGEPRYTRTEACEKAGVDLEFGRRFWRAAGFPEVPDDTRMFTDADVKMLRGIVGLLESEVADMDVALEITRVIGQTSSRLAAAEISVLRERITRPPVTSEGIDADAASEALEIASSALPFLEDALVYLWQRHLSASAKQALVLASQDQPVKCVGFVDMTRFSTQSRSLAANELERLINRFESIAFDVIAEYGGRVVKLIGDEVMFVADDPAAAATIALSLVERLDEEPDVPRVRAGVSYGPVVEIQGDVFGGTVNLASRLTEVAKAGTVVVPEALKVALEEAGGYELKRIRRIATLKGTGKVKAYNLKRAESTDEAQVVP
jgi:adenylate cyclase